MKTDLAVELIRTMQLVQRYVRRYLVKESRAGFSMSQIRILSVLVENSYSLSDLAEFVGVEVTSMSRMIQVLEKRDLVSRQISARDRRKVHFELTPKGRKAHAKVSTVVREQLRGHLKNLSRPEAEEIERALEILQGLFKVNR
jgi:DNA-binding MarR family transcriptional regulator